MVVEQKGPNGFIECIAKSEIRNAMGTFSLRNLNGQPIDARVDGIQIDRLPQSRKVIMGLKWIASNEYLIHHIVVGHYEPAFAFKPRIDIYHQNRYLQSSNEVMEILQIREAYTFTPQYDLRRRRIKLNN